MTCCCESIRRPDPAKEVIAAMRGFTAEAAVRSRPIMEELDFRRVTLEPMGSLTFGGIQLILTRRTRSRVQEPAIDPREAARESQ
jgi:hypothetical protein